MDLCVPKFEMQPQNSSMRPRDSRKTSPGPMSMLSGESLAAMLATCQDRKREGDLLYGTGRFEEASAVYSDANALLELPNAESGFLPRPPTQCPSVHSPMYRPVCRLVCLFLCASSVCGLSVGLSVCLSKRPGARQRVRQRIEKEWRRTGRERK